MSERNGIRWPNKKIHGIAHEKFALTNPDFDEQVAALHPIGRASMPSEQAAAACWLLSDEASFVTGAILPVDGGYTAVYSS